MRALLKLAEKSFTILALLLFSGAVLAVVLRPSGASAAGSSVFQAIWFVVYLITLCLLAIHSKGFTRIPSNLDFNQPLLLLIGVASFSFYWSDAPSVTLRRSIALAGTTLFGVYLAARYSPREQLRLLAWTFGIGAVLSVLFALFLPSYGRDVYPYAGVWRGVYVQKNSLGRIMTLSSFVFLLIALSRHRYRWIAWSGFGLSAALILLSLSKTALIVFLTVSILLPFYGALRWQSTVFVPLFIITILLVGTSAIWVTSEAETLLGFIGKDLTLTGRTVLWEVVFTMIQQRPWLGYGYSAFWLGLNGASAYIWDVINWEAPHAHNGFLDLWLELGILGVSIFVLSFLMTLVKAVAWTRHSQTFEDFWPLVYLTVVLLVNMTQNTILTQNDIFWIIYVMINFRKPDQYHRSAKLPTDTIPKKGGWGKNV